jgi:pectinesterase
MKLIKITFLFLLVINSFLSKASIYITVAADGSGDFRTINEAIFSLPMFNYERAIIFVKNGTYYEKFRIDQDFITLRGENREKTIIRYNQPRPQWLAKKDSVGPGVINIFGDDIVIENLTVENTQKDTKVHAFVIYGFGTRIILQNCSFISQGGDTVSLWDYKTGMYYHANCTFVGAVDFVCPRGWCFIKDSKFYEVTKTAAIWHAGGFDKNQKFIIRNSYFDGVKDFDLGRHHYDAQFYLIDCTFSDSMSNNPIYRVVSKDPKANRAFNWGERYFFFNCHRKGGDYKWFSDNLIKANDKLKSIDINSSWTFEGKWLPESVQGPKVEGYQIQGNMLILVFNELITITGEPVLKSGSGKVFTYDSGRGSNTLQFKCNDPFTRNDLTELKISNNAKITGTIASVIERQAEIKIK